MDLGDLTSKEIGQIMSKGLLREVQNGDVLVSDGQKVEINDSNIT